MISRARKISNHPFLLFWDESEQKLTSDTLKSEDDEFIETRQQLIKLVFSQREKSGKFKIVEKLLKQWYTEETEAKNKVLLFSQTKIVLDIIEMILEYNNMSFRVRL